MIYPSIGLDGFLCSMSNNPYIGKENLYKTKPNVKMYLSEDKNSLRLIYHKGNHHIAVVQIMIPSEQRLYDRTPTLANMFCLPNHRRKGYTKYLYGIGKEMFKNLVFSPNLSDDGKAFSNKMLNNSL